MRTEVIIIRELTWLSALSAFGAGFAISRNDVNFSIAFIALGLAAIFLLFREKRTYCL